MAQCKALVPSAERSFTSMRGVALRSVRTPSPSASRAANASGAGRSIGSTTGPAQASGASQDRPRAAAARSRGAGRAIVGSDLGDRAGAVADLVERDSRTLQDRQQHVRKRRARWEIDVLAAANPPAAAADDGGRQWILVV